MSEVNDTRNIKTFKVTIDEETKENFGGYVAYIQLIKQINSRLGGEDKWYIESYHAEKDDKGTITFSAKVILHQSAHVNKERLIRGYLTSGGGRLFQSSLLFPENLRLGITKIASLGIPGP
ncbi:6248_t:CDS:2, partial [Cetraspora pellucida]